MKKTIFFLLFLFPAIFLYADNFTRGELVYFEGEISLQHNNDILLGDDIQIGDFVEEYDLISTGEDGYAEILVKSDVSARIVLKIEPNSNLYFKIDKKEGNRNFNLKLLSGNIFAKVDKLVGKGSVDITARSSVMGIRGTELYITSSTDGSLLVTCPEGKVSCRTAGSEVIAGEGNAAEILYGRPAKTISVSDDIAEKYRTEWAAERERVFRSMSFSIIKPSAIQYEELYSSFENMYKDIKKHRKIFNKYLKEGKTAVASEVVRDKITVSPAVISMRGVFFRFEQQFYRINELKRYYDENPVKGKIGKDYSVSDFMKDYGKNYSDVEKMLLNTRSAFKSFTFMEPFGPGQSTLMEDIFSGNPLAE